ncbi:hypothetical protein niasHT_019273 [Heterodera trifolii]|uniref:Uncharacterized protein n=1 Tax=Heterodera trifolii TaxID=157864 RepID=A0ABD2L0U0_9BILA
MPPSENLFNISLNVNDLEARPLPEPQQPEQQQQPQQQQAELLIQIGDVEDALLLNVHEGEERGEEAEQEEEEHNVEQIEELMRLHAEYVAQIFNEIADDEINNE